MFEVLPQNGAETNTRPALLTPDSLENRQKNWDVISSYLDHIADRLGKGLDAGIKDAVVALVVLDIHTRQSCEGHLDHGVAAPWIDVEPEDNPDILALRERYRELSTIADQKEHDDENQQGLDNIYLELREIQAKLQKHKLQEFVKVHKLLMLFYKEYSADADRMLVINNTGRLMSQGALFQDIHDDVMRQTNLDLYRQEMASFTDFLRRRYLE